MPLVREDRGERTSGVPVVLPRALPGSYSTDQISAESILSAKLTSRLDFPMRTLKDDQFDRRKVEVQQCMEPKRTNSPIDFLRSLIRSSSDGKNERSALTSYWCLSFDKTPVCLTHLNSHASHEHRDV